MSPEMRGRWRSDNPDSYRDAIFVFVQRSNKVEQWKLALLVCLNCYKLAVNFLHICRFHKIIQTLDY